MHEKKRVNFDQVEKVAEENSNYVKIKDGQTVLLKFLRDEQGLPKMYEVDRDFGGNKSKAIEYEVIDVNVAKQKTVQFSLSWALNLNEILKEGYSLIKVKRTGSGLDTSYSFVPSNENK